MKESNWNKYHLASTPKGVDYVIDHILINDPDFSDLDTLTRQIEKGTLEFIGMLRDSYLNKETDSFGVRTLEEVFGSQNTNQDMDEHLFSDFTEDSIRS